MVWLSCAGPGSQEIGVYGILLVVDKLFAAVGKLVIVFVVIGIIAVGGFYLGRYLHSGSNTNANINTPVATITPTETAQNISPTVPVSSPSAAPDVKKVSAGMTTTVFSSYSIL